MTEVVILGGARTAWVEYAGTPGFGLFRDISCIDLCAIAAKKALEKSKVKPDWINHVVIGNAFQSSHDSVYGARHVGLKAGLPISIPALTVNRLCGSGIESVAVASRMIKLNEADFVLAGGMENMSQAPYILRGLRGESRTRFGQDLILEDSLFRGLKDFYCNMLMAQTAENCAKKYGIPREAQDEFACRSHTLVAKAAQSGIFREEIAPVTVKDQIVDKDDHIKPDTTLEKLAKLSPAFGPGGTVTAGNASGIVDGAAAVIVTHEVKAKEFGLNPIGRIINYAVVGVEPEYMGMGPVPAIKKVLELSSTKLDQVDLFEINEAFAAQYLSVEKALALDRNKVNVNGGAIALGHPLGATGTRLILTLLYQLRRAKKKIGIASACIGGGQGIAMLLERL